ncbi:unnamed protein product [Lactuca virosa]|uniref:Replication protein A OB domain-containing protein n=1 Tax=Lactuca virosa TaxID=75947 RepID=A0AAU9N305_9ASTR|nr:unnamed protein product [Lactuca virosa]
MYPTVTLPNKLHTVDTTFSPFETWFIAVDKYEGSIQILGEKADQEHAETMLHISKCYAITDYTCSEPDQHQKVLQNTLHLNVGPASSIEEIADSEALPTTWFRFVSRQHLNEIVNKNNELPDFVSIFIKLRDCKKRDGEAYINLFVRDEKDEIMVTLWKECIDSPAKFDRRKITTSVAPVIIAITNVKVTTYPGVLKLNSTSATHVYVNPPVKEKVNLTERF